MDHPKMVLSGRGSQKQVNLIAREVVLNPNDEVLPFKFIYN